MTYIMSCVWLDYMVKYFQCKNCVGSSPKTKKCVASFLVPGDKKTVRAFARAVFYIEQHKCECKFTFERKLANKKPKICSFSKLDFGFYSPTIMFTQRY